MQTVEGREDAFTVTVGVQRVVFRTGFHELSHLGDRFENVTVAVGHRDLSSDMIRFLGKSQSLLQ